VGEEIRDAIPSAANQPGIGAELGSILIAVATDAPLLPHQLKRLARRAAMGLARTGSTSMNGSGDLFLAFSTAETGAPGAKGAQSVRMLPNEEMDSVFEATVESVEEAIVNAMVAAENMTGIQKHTVTALPHDRLREVLRKYGR
jgi:L-aminopeptidase/D-esterase-like protein